MNIQRKNSAHHFRMQSEREQTLVSRSPPVFLTILCQFFCEHIYVLYGDANEPVIV